MKVQPSSAQLQSNDAEGLESDVDDASMVEVVENFFCEDYGLDIPQTFEACGNDDCPSWHAGEWLSCQQSRCFGRNTAIQRREVSCRFNNNSLAQGCEEIDRPVSRQECYNERCKGVWRVEPWSEVIIIKFYSNCNAFFYACFVFILCVLII